MTSYPNSIYSPREKQNKSGVVYNPDKKQVLFAEDIVNDDNEIVAIETALGVNLENIGKSFGITVDGGGSVVSAGSKGAITIPYSCEIKKWYLVGDQSGDIEFDIRIGGNSIIGDGNAPILSSAQSGNADVADWTTPNVVAGNIVEFFVVGTPALITRVNLVLKVNL